MRAAMAQLCVNPFGGRLVSLLMPRSPWETSWGGPEIPLHTPPPVARGCPPGQVAQQGWGLFRSPLGLRPWGSALVRTPQQLLWSFAGVGAASLQQQQKHRVVCTRGQGSKQLLSRSHKLFWEELGACWAGK